MADSDARQAPDWGKVCAEWRAVVGEAHVVDGGPELLAAHSATFATTQRIPAIVRPSTTSEVSAVLRTASEHGAPVHPVSRGKSWGFGSRVPAKDQTALLDLRRMARVVDYDEDLAYVTVEPGVTFGALYEFLKNRGSRLFASTTGAGPESSVLANALERGDGSGPLGDRFAHACALEVVLPTGDIVHTGFDRFESTPLGPLHRWGVGPALDGLFSQSRFGVVTKMTIWLAPLPRALVAIRFEITREARLGGVVDAIRTLRLEGTLRAVTGLWNDARVRATSPDAKLAAEWFGLTAVYAATPEIARATADRVREVLGPSVDWIEATEAFGDPKSGAELLMSEHPGFQFLQGVPHEESLKSAYAKKAKPGPRPLDLDRDRCGAMWICPTTPLVGTAVETAARIAREKLDAHGFEPMIAMVAQTERTMYVVPLIVWDRDVERADERAQACHDALFAEYAAAGFLPHRLGIQSYDAMPSPRDAYASVLEAIRRVLDPSDVLAPGRYGT